MENNNAYPPSAFHFKAEFFFNDGSAKSEIDFQEISGLNKEMLTEDFTEGGENRFVYSLPKGTKYPKLMLKRAMEPTSDIINWVRNSIDNFDFSPVNVTVTLLNPNSDPLITWEFIGCWPLKWSTSDLKSQENAIAIETLELNYNYYVQKTQS